MLMHENNQCISVDERRNILPWVNNMQVWESIRIVFPSYCILSRLNRG